MVTATPYSLTVSGQHTAIGDQHTESARVWPTGVTLLLRGWVTEPPVCLDVEVSVHQDEEVFVRHDMFRMSRRSVSTSEKQTSRRRRSLSWRPAPWIWILGKRF